MFVQLDSVQPIVLSNLAVLFPRSGGSRGKGTLPLLDGSKSRRLVSGGSVSRAVGLGFTVEPLFEARAYLCDSWIKRIFP